MRGKRITPKQRSPVLPEIKGGAPGDDLRFLGRMMDLLPGGLYIYDLDLRRNVFMNRGLAELLGMSVEECANPDRDAVTRLMNPEDLPRFRQHLEKVKRLPDGEAAEYDYRLRRKDGEYRWFRSRDAVFSRRPDGAVGRIIGLAGDVTSQKKAEAAVAESEERVRLALQAANQGLYDLNVQTGEAKISPEYATMLGYDPGNFHETNAGWIERLHLDDRDRVAEAYRAYINGAIPAYAVEFRQRTATGEWKWILSRGRIVSRDSAGKPLRMLGTHTDITERKLAEEVVQKSEARLRLLADNMADTISQVDAKGIMVYASPSIERVYGYRFQDLLGHPALEKVHPQDAKAVLRTFRDAAAAGKSGLRLEYRYRRADGDYLWVESHVRLLYDDSGNPAGAIFGSRDIHERKQVEEALRESEARYRSLFEANPHPMWVYDLETLSFLAVNDAAVAHYGFSREDFLARTIADIRPPEDIQRLKENIARVEDQGVDKAGVWRHRKKDGSLIDVEITSHVLNYRGRRAELVLVNDVTERKQAEEALRVSRERFRSLVETTGDMIWETDRQGAYTYVSPQATDLLGYSPPEMIGRKPFDYMPADEARRIAAVFERAAGQGKPILNVENTNLHKDGRPVVLETSGVPVFDSSGSLRGYRGIDRDITRRREVESERLNLERQFRHAQKLESLGILAGGIAHDFNNLLTAMIGHAELGLLKMAPEDPARANILNIVKTARRAAELSSQMLAYSGKGKFVVECVNLNELIAEMSHLLSVSVAKGVDLRCEFAENVPAIEGDATQIRQVLMNLVTNASEAIVGGNGRIAIATGTEECRRDYLDAQNPAFRAGVDPPLEEGAYVYLEVRDSGCGMAPETMERIFDPFFSTKFTGRGLGMAAVMGIVRGHRGAIKIWSEVNRGTTFRILLPASAKAADFPPATRKKTGEAAWTGKGLVLLVDDEEAVRAVGEAMLLRMGFSVVTAADGLEAVSTFRERAGEVVCVVLDMTMPRLDGEGAFREIRKIREDVAVVLSSGYNEQETTKRFKGECLAGFLHKPYQFADFAGKMREALGKKGSQE